MGMYQIHDYGEAKMVNGIATVNDVQFPADDSECLVRVGPGFYVSLIDHANNMFQVKSKDAANNSTFGWDIIS